ncbi:hypothetical protein JCGZ_12426 [Jatropha curcas]|uniref:HXXXD-type acyl-transferase family protein n=1 Tax=Jatropha curcas TaxID=180498 RepID=A0A067KI66_JATCU|nr:uncharacterized acetyltransferase At3g50280 [Jatropha curcas]KDP31965.1 hypothetical protein JCGZ_12426 [Jatropha curcas]
MEQKLKESSRQKSKEALLIATIKKMAAVELISTSIVQATSSKESTQRIELMSSDLKFLLVETIQKGLLFHKPKPPEGKISDKTFLQHLKHSLSFTLNFFTPLAGRLATVEHDDNTVSFFIDCNNSGVQFIHAVADNITISDILEPIYVPSIVHSFFPLNGMKNYHGISKPLVAVQVTELDDGIFIGCTMNHVVADGTTFWNFINSWSEISRGSDHITKPPVFEHWFRSNSYNCPIRLPLSVIKTNNSEAIPTLKQERVFHFTKEKIAWLKEKAKTESGCERISTLQSILAHLWRSVIRNEQSIDPDQETNFHFHIGIRTRLQPPIPEEYFGTATQTGTVTLKARELMENGLGYAALQINRMIAGYTEDKVRNNLESWVKNPKLYKQGGFPENDLITSSSPRFNVYGNDFNWGRPIAVRSGPGNKYCRKITLFPEAEEGSVDIEVSFSPEILTAMGSDPEFMDAVTV